MFYDWISLGKSYKQGFKKHSYISRYRFFYQELILKRTLRYIKNNYRCSNILEVGSGFGRIKNLIDFDCNYLSLDISIDQLKNNESRNKINSDIEFLPFQDNQFNLILAVEVLMHIDKELIKNILEEFKRISCKILILDWYNPGSKIGLGCYNHNYQELVKDAALISYWDIKYILGENQRIYFIIL